MRFDAPVLLYGAGREARSTRAFVKARAPDLPVYVTVDSGSADIDDAHFIAPTELQAAIAERRFGTIVKSPGVSRYRPIFLAAREAGIAVTSNLNLWGEYFREGRTVIAITGTKGKSTTATLTWLMLREAGFDAGLAGNVGLAPLEIADRNRIVVFELSSYQTADMAFSPDIAAITNLTPEHTDWHRTTERYYDSDSVVHPKRIFFNDFVRIVKRCKNQCNCCSMTCQARKAGKFKVRFCPDRKKYRPEIFFEKFGLVKNNVA